MTLRDPKTGQFIRNRASKHLSMTYALGLLKTGVYATCFSAFLGMLAATILFLQIETLKRDVAVQKAAINSTHFDSGAECFTLKEEPSTEVIGMIDSHELAGEPEAPVLETEKPRPLIRVIRNGKTTYE